VLLLTVGVALAGWQAVTALGSSGSSGDKTPSSSPSARTPAAVQVVAAKDFDPEGDGTENGDRVGRAIDGDLSTEWTTKTYKDQLGPSGLKNGVGLILDLGKATDVSQVRVSLDGTGTGLQLRTSDSEGSRLADWTEVADVSTAGTTATLRPDKPVTARYLLLWLTALPQADGGYRGGIAEVSVRG
jgi:putative peptidoglycan lipid II flippase